MNAAMVTLRVGAIGVALAAWFTSQRFLAARPAPGDGIGDLIHRWTAPLNALLAARPRAADAVLIASPAGIDGFGLFLLGASVFGPTLRPFLSLLALFAMRQLCQGLCALPPPEGVIWRHPGVPSLLVTYGTANDFFFSGHTAVAVLGAIELSAMGPGWLGAAGWSTAILEAAVVLVLRAHYTLDVVSAAFAAWCACSFGGAIAPHVDSLLARLG